MMRTDHWEAFNWSRLVKIQSDVMVMDFRRKRKRKRKASTSVQFWTIISTQVDSWTTVQTGRPTEGDVS